MSIHQWAISAFLDMCSTRQGVKRRRANSHSDYETLEVRRVLLSPDAFEPNDLPNGILGGAPEITRLGEVEGEKSFSNLSIFRDSLTAESTIGIQASGSRGDDDWFEFTTKSVGQVSNYVRIDFDGTVGNLELRVTGSSGTLVTSANREEFSLNGLAAGTYRIHVYGLNGAQGGYTLTLAAPTPRPPTGLSISANTIQENLPTGSTVGTLTTTDADVGDSFRYSLVSGEGSTDNSAFSISGNQLKTNAVFDFESKNIYRVRVRTTDQSGLFFEQPFTILVRASNGGGGGGSLGDRSEPNNSNSTATSLGTLTGLSTISGHSISTSTDEDFFKFVTTATGGSGDFVRLDISTSGKDLDLYLLDSSGNEIDSSAGVTSSEQISLQNRAAGTYYVRVKGYSGAQSAYTLTIDAPASTGGGGNSGGNNGGGQTSAPLVVAQQVSVSWVGTIDLDLALPFASNRGLRVEIDATRPPAGLVSARGGSVVNYNPNGKFATQPGQTLGDIFYYRLVNSSGIASDWAPVRVSVLHAQVVQMYRAYNPNADFHFFTTSRAQFENAVFAGYRDESTSALAGFTVFVAPTGAPIYRLYNLSRGFHYYTTNGAERDQLVSLTDPGPNPANGWRYEGIEGYGSFSFESTRSRTIYRLYNQNSGVHMYTENAAARDGALAIADAATGGRPWRLENDLTIGESLPIFLGSQAQTRSLSASAAPSASLSAQSEPVLDQAAVNGGAPVGFNAEGRLLTGDSANSFPASLVLVISDGIAPPSPVRESTGNQSTEVAAVKACAGKADHSSTDIDEVFLSVDVSSLIALGDIL